MRFGAPGAALIGVGLMLAGCASPDNQSFSNFAVQLGVDPQDAAGRAVEGAVLGAYTFDKYRQDTSLEELTEMVVAEYRKALEERHRSAS